MSQNMANPSMFPLPNRVQYLTGFVYSPEISLVTLSSQLIFSMLFSISTFQRLSNLLSVSTSTSLLHTVLHSRPNISLFSSLVPLILPVNSLFFSINTFFAISILLRISFVQYPSSDIKLPIYLN